MEYALEEGGVDRRHLQPQRETMTPSRAGLPADPMWNSESRSKRMAIACAN
jgi:hypothetical protein